MKKLSIATIANLEKLREMVESAHSEAQSAASDLNEILSRLRDLNEAYNNGLTDAAETVREYTSERSDKWRESEASDAYATWIDELESATLDADEPEDVEVADLDFPELPELGG